MTPKQKADIMAMNRDGLSIEEIAAATGKKEPAQAATCTDSEAVIGNDNTNSLCLNDTTDREKSQALSGISGLSCMESALDEWLGLGQEAEIVSLRADRTDSELVFEHKGEKYIIAFGRYEK